MEVALRCNRAQSYNEDMINQIEHKYGSLDNFIEKAKEWLDEIPDPCINANNEIRIIANKEVNWGDPAVLASLERKMTSVEHARWLHSILDRIDKVESQVQSTDVEDMAEKASGVPKATGLHLGDFIVNRLEKKKQSARDFVQSVREHVHEELAITPKQIEALNDIYERYEL